MRAILLSLPFLAWAAPSRAAIVRVSNLDALTKAVASAQAGDEVVLQDGSYTASGTLTLTSSAGTADKPVVVRSNTIGGATIRGTAAWVVDRSAYLDLRGFRFLFTAQADKGVQIKASHHIGILDNHFELAEAATKNYWLVIDGALADGSAPHHITIARNDFWNKTQEGCFVVVYGTSSPYQVAKQVRIEGNHFKGHSFTGSNGGEAIRFGDSNRQNDITDSEVKGNLFEQCDGDVEVVSVKTTRLRVEGNTLRDNAGSIVLRHGDSCIVSGNFLIGNRGGIRIYGDHQKVIGNYLEGNTNTKADGSVSGSYATLGIGMGSQADLANGENTYDQPSNGVVAFNTLVNNDSRGLEVVRIKTEALAPSNMAILNNIVASDKSALSAFAATPLGADIAGNLLFGKASKGDLPAAFSVDPKFVRGTDSLLRPDPSSPVVDAAVASPFLPSWYRTDMDGQTRGTRFDLGADEVSTATPVVRPLRASDVGPRVGQPLAVGPRAEGSVARALQGAVEVRVLAGDGGLVRAVRLDASEVPDRLAEGLRSGVYTVRIQQGSVRHSKVVVVP
jgi:poly(beta-D-mannuronate) lyase